MTITLNNFLKEAQTIIDKYKKENLELQQSIEAGGEAFYAQRVAKFSGQDILYANLRDDLKNLMNKYFPDVKKETSKEIFS